MDGLMVDSYNSADVYNFHGHPFRMYSQIEEIWNICVI